MKAYEGERTQSWKIYNNLINSQGIDFWSVPSEKGLDILIECKDILLQFKSSEIFDGKVYWTYTTVAEKITTLERRIKQWKNVLNAEGIMVENNWMLLKKIV